MSRTRRMATAVAATLAAVLGVGVMTAPVGATTALWQDQVTIPGVTIVAGPTSEPTPDEPPIEIVDPNKYPDRVHLPSGSALTFDYTLKINLNQYPLPLVLEMGHGWGRMVSEGSPSINGDQGNKYWVPQFNSEGEVIGKSERDFSLGEADIPGGTSRSLHYFHRGEHPNWGKGVQFSEVPEGVNEIEVDIRFKVENYYSDKRFEIWDGSGFARLYNPGPDEDTPLTEPALFKMDYKLPALCNGGAGVEGCDPPAPTAPPEWSQPEDDQATPAPVPDPTSSPDPTSDDVATTRDEDLEASP
ncbi:hypothetical protein [Cellulomonas xiejunii]|uniref:Uncharacterized protein n=1 Tax=Cellulomonas xiejunii TaxID=2968083 RepID=A0ABY5KMD1_9CELL|nr:hypothetical protein [Cellulomonas xiejunii]MCC2321074.1 hypothetical protein [Cellulomonas xiejunii]UUI71667.1 hypothetical protein NP048_18060 [Cellulomonas xiejunii]